VVTERLLYNTKKDHAGPHELDGARRPKYKGQIFHRSRNTRSRSLDAGLPDCTRNRARGFTDLMSLNKKAVRRDDLRASKSAAQARQALTGTTDHGTAVRGVRERRRLPRLLFWPVGHARPCRRKKVPRQGGHPRCRRPRWADLRGCWARGLRTRNCATWDEVRGTTKGRGANRR